MVQHEVRLCLLQGALDCEEEGPWHSVLLRLAEVLLARLSEVVAHATVEGQRLATEGCLEVLRELHHGGSCPGPIPIFDLGGRWYEEDLVRFKRPLRPHLHAVFFSGASAFGALWTTSKSFAV